MKHFRSIDEAGVDGILRLLDLADHMAEVNRRPNPKVPALRGKTVCNVFFEDSTRTRLSFETAAKRLSADTMTFAVSPSSVNKGESLRDTIETIAAMGVDAFVIRHGSSGVPWQVEPVDQRRASSTPATAGTPIRRRRCSTATRSARRSTGPAVSTGSGSRSSATSSTAGSPAATSGVQAAGRRRHAGRAAHAAAAVGRRAGHDRPRRRHRRRRRALPAADAAGADDRVAGAPLREYTTRFGLTPDRAARLPEHALIMHPGPMNRGVEIAVDPSELPGSVITQQVTNGIAVRMAVLFELLGSGTDLEENP